MASDQELARHVSRLEETRRPEEQSIAEELDEYRATAGEIHDELARRIERVDDDAVDEADLSDVIDRLDRLEARLDELEAER